MYIYIYNIYICIYIGICIYIYVCVCIILMFVAWKKKTWYRSKLKTGGPEIEVLVKSNVLCALCTKPIVWF
jgi:hypothetical protein